MRVRVRTISHNIWPHFLQSPLALPYVYFLLCFIIFLDSLRRWSEVIVRSFSQGFIFLSSSFCILQWLSSLLHPRIRLCKTGVVYAASWKKSLSFCSSFALERGHVIFLQRLVGIVAGASLIFWHRAGICPFFFFSISQLIFLSQIFEFNLMLMGSSKMKLEFWCLHLYISFLQRLDFMM